jgi:hypothetical protein
MTDGQLNLDPQRAMGGARDLAAAGKNLKSLRDSAGGEISASSAKPPWGSDDIGAAFEKTYRKLEQQTLTSWEKLAAYVEGLGYAAAQTVNNNMQADGEAGTRVHKAWKER